MEVTALSNTQLERVVEIFNEMSRKTLLPIYEIANDPIRKELDEDFGRRVLCLPESVLVDSGLLELFRMKISREPSVGAGSNVNLQTIWEQDRIINSSKYNMQ